MRDPELLEHNIEIEQKETEPFALPRGPKRVKPLFFRIPKPTHISQGSVESPAESIHG